MSKTIIIVIFIKLFNSNLHIFGLNLTSRDFYFEELNHVTKLPNKANVNWYVINFLNVYNRIDSILSRKYKKHSLKWNI